ncbi:MAG: amino acid adenylation domain-containing protein [Candidatus Eisenbacteria bacterium]|uniref:Amino acid adenylation domain-containing protein n=1 Tax=Eiseniibacteriota bacterium TaxID=2212470 RepID=A0A849SKF7_UNCEI|nr:amino acid adenylation domain-containing protein [Candidatus Eisenbacteria bacterium]
MDGQRLTYAELEAQSNQFARALTARGVKLGDRVGLWLPKSPAALVALWGAMKAGAVYVPIDPGAPPARAGLIARDCELAALVSRLDRRAELEQALADGPSLRAIWLADATAAEAPSELDVAGTPLRAWASLATEDSSPPPNPASPDDLAYILYTSGSTGEPKGVMHSHRSGLAFPTWAAAAFGLTHEDRISNHAPLHFDLSTFDVFATATAGACVYPVSAKLASFPAAIAKLYAKERLTVWYETPSSLALMMGRGGLASLDLSAVRVLLFAGEVMPPKHLRELMQLMPGARFANLYGPTETNVCTCYEASSLPIGDSSLPIGTPSCGDRAHVLDEQRQPCAPGTPGELWVSGPTLMRGYWGRAELTARTLAEIESPAGPVRTYRTGDLVREREDGKLEFLGRRDHQIKTRGYRVELGEIETALLSHADVAEAIALAIPDDEVTNRLKALVVLRPATTLDEATLKQHCARSLPRYMVPEWIEFRSEFPRTSSGKIDRRSLAGA